MFLFYGYKSTYEIFQRLKWYLRWRLYTQEVVIYLNYYNISWKGGHGVKDCWSEESKIKNSNSQKISQNKPEVKEKKSKATKGKKRSLKSRLKMSKSKKGKPSPNKGKKMSLKTCLSMSNAKKGKPSPKKGKKILVQMIEKYGEIEGSKHYEEYLRKLRESNKSRPVQSKETREKRSKSLIGRIKSPEECKHISEGLKGHIVTPETIEKLKNAFKHEKIVCEYCKREIPYINYFQWHGKKCKMRFDKDEDGKSVEGCIEKKW